MKIYSIKTLLIAVGVFAFVGCDKDDDKNNTPVYYQTQDQMARPAINTVFVSASDKDVFNTTTPSAMNGLFGSKFKSRLMALNPGYTTNLLGLNADQFTGVLVTDVLNASTTAPTSFYDGTNVLTGRALADDVIDVELTLIFGGPTGTSNPGLTSDKVNANDKAFLTAFPYLANPH
ncbi:DUF4331 domain-containing protein [Niastella caeni]|uniref:DUF4331 domain-containing protein n=1 Tax=Niastella caeni TaxID=2569763 RepID=A0A4S8HTT4_9BACT|nr:DUF4331 family protein [Niastella caeni]THU38039.1 DUF4331 domain-containing protein [Niastella caeni]